MTDREINEAVARRLGWKQVPSKCRGDCELDWQGPPSPDLNELRCTPIDYCGSIQAAWEIVKQLECFGKLIQFSYLPKFQEWVVNITDGKSMILEEKATKKTLPLAICEAFLTHDEKSR